MSNQPEREWKKKLRQLPQLYKASEGDIMAIESFIASKLEGMVSVEEVIDAITELKKHAIGSYEIEQTLNIVISLLEEPSKSK